MTFYYCSVTESIEVKVFPTYLEEQSLPHENYYIWIYNIKIKNNGKSIVQLLNRYWKIIDSTGIINEISGAGVIGEQPIIKPQEFFEYTSGTYLSTPFGIMQGEFQFINEDQAKLFSVNIPTFFLHSPYIFTKPH